MNDASTPSLPLRGGDYDEEAAFPTAHVDTGSRAERDAALDVGVSLTRPSAFVKAEGNVAPSREPFHERCNRGDVLGGDILFPARAVGDDVWAVAERGDNIDGEREDTDEEPNTAALAHEVAQLPPSTEAQHSEHTACASTNSSSSAGRCNNEEEVDHACPRGASTDRARHGDMARELPRGLHHHNSFFSSLPHADSLAVGIRRDSPPSPPPQTRHSAFPPSADGSTATSGARGLTSDAAAAATTASFLHPADTTITTAGASQVTQPTFANSPATFDNGAFPFLMEPFRHQQHQQQQHQQQQQQPAEVPGTAATALAFSPPPPPLALTLVLLEEERSRLDAGDRPQQQEQPPLPTTVAESPILCLTAEVPQDGGVSPMYTAQQHKKVTIERSHASGSPDGSSGAAPAPEPTSAAATTAALTTATAPTIPSWTQGARGVPMAQWDTTVLSPLHRSSSTAPFPSPVHPPSVIVSRRSQDGANGPSSPLGGGGRPTLRSLLTSPLHRDVGPDCAFLSRYSSQSEANLCPPQLQQQQQRSTYSPLGTWPPAPARCRSDGPPWHSHGAAATSLTVTAATTTTAGATAAATTTSLSERNLLSSFEDVARSLPGKPPLEQGHRRSSPVVRRSLSSGGPSTQAGSYPLPQHQQQRQRVSCDTLQSFDELSNSRSHGGGGGAWFGSYSGSRAYAKLSDDKSPANPNRDSLCSDLALPMLNTELLAHSTSAAMATDAPSSPSVLVGTTVTSTTGPPSDQVAKVAKATRKHAKQRRGPQSLPTSETSPRANREDPAMVSRPLCLDDASDDTEDGGGSAASSSSRRVGAWGSGEAAAEEEDGMPTFSFSRTLSPLHRGREDDAATTARERTCPGAVVLRHRRCGSVDPTAAPPRAPQLPAAVAVADSLKDEHRHRHRRSRKCRPAGPEANTDEVGERLLYASCSEEEPCGGCNDEDGDGKGEKRVRSQRAASDQDSAAVIASHCRAHSKRSSSSTRADSSEGRQSTSTRDPDAESLWTSKKRDPRGNLEALRPPAIQTSASTSIQTLSPQSPQSPRHPTAPPPAIPAREQRGQQGPGRLEAQTAAVPARSSASSDSSSSVARSASPSSSGERELQRLGHATTRDRKKSLNPTCNLLLERDGEGENNNDDDDEDDDDEDEHPFLFRPLARLRHAKNTHDDVWSPAEEEDAGWRQKWHHRGGGGHRFAQPSCSDMDGEDDLAQAFANVTRGTGANTTAGSSCTFDDDFFGLKTPLSPCPSNTAPHFDVVARMSPLSVSATTRRKMKERVQTAWGGQPARSRSGTLCSSLSTTALVPSPATAAAADSTGKGDSVQESAPRTATNASSSIPISLASSSSRAHTRYSPMHFTTSSSLEPFLTSEEETGDNGYGGSSRQGCGHSRPSSTSPLPLPSSAQGPTQALRGASSPPRPSVAPPTTTVAAPMAISVAAASREASEPVRSPTRSATTLQQPTSTPSREVVAPQTGEHAAASSAREACGEKTDVNDENSVAHSDGQRGLHQKAEEDVDSTGVAPQVLGESSNSSPGHLLSAIASSSPNSRSGDDLPSERCVGGSFFSAELSPSTLSEMAVGGVMLPYVVGLPSAAAELCQRTQPEEAARSNAAILFPLTYTLPSAMSGAAGHRRTPSSSSSSSASSFSNNSPCSLVRRRPWDDGVAGQDRGDKGNPSAPLSGAITAARPGGSTTSPPSVGTTLQDTTTTTIAAPLPSLRPYYGSASFRGSRSYQEDNFVVLPDIVVDVATHASGGGGGESERLSGQATTTATEPFTDGEGREARRISCFGVFDGHNGDEVSYKASQYFLEHFMLAYQQHHSTHLAHARHGQHKPTAACESTLDDRESGATPTDEEGDEQSVLSSALVQSLLHLDVTVHDALRLDHHRSDVGSTACVAACYLPDRKPRQIAADHTVTMTMNTTTTKPSNVPTPHPSPALTRSSIVTSRSTAVKASLSGTGAAAARQRTPALSAKVPLLPVSPKLTRSGAGGGSPGKLTPDSSSVVEEDCARAGLYYACHRTPRGCRRRSSLATAGSSGNVTGSQGIPTPPLTASQQHDGNKPVQHLAWDADRARAAAAASADSVHEEDGWTPLTADMLPMLPHSTAATVPAAYEQSSLGAGSQQRDPSRGTSEPNSVVVHGTGSRPEDDEGGRMHLEEGEEGEEEDLDYVKLSIANLGDSRAVIGNALTGELLLETTDHRIGRHPTERGRVLAAGGTVDFDRVEGCLDVSRGLGDYRLKRHPTTWWSQSQQTQQCDDEAGPAQAVGNIVSNIADVYECDVRASDFLVIASDGVWDRMSSEDVVSFVANDLKEMLGKSSLHCTAAGAPAGTGAGQDATSPSLAPTPAKDCSTLATDTTLWSAITSTPANDSGETSGPRAGARSSAFCRPSPPGAQHTGFVRGPSAGPRPSAQHPLRLSLFATPPTENTTTTTTTTTTADPLTSLSPTKLRARHMLHDIRAAAPWSVGQAMSTFSAALQPPQPPQGRATPSLPSSMTAAHARTGGARESQSAQTLSGGVTEGSEDTRATESLPLATTRGVSETIVEVAPEARRAVDPLDALSSSPVHPVGASSAENPISPSPRLPSTSVHRADTFAVPLTPCSQETAVPFVLSTTCEGEKEREEAGRAEDDSANGAVEVLAHDEGIPTPTLRPAKPFLSASGQFAIRGADGRRLDAGRSHAAASYARLSSACMGQLDREDAVSSTSNSAADDTAGDGSPGSLRRPSRPPSRAHSQGSLWTRSALVHRRRRGHCKYPSSMPTSAHRTSAAPPLPARNEEGTPSPPVHNDSTRPVIDGELLPVVAQQPGDGRSPSSEQHARDGSENPLGLLEAMLSANGDGVQSDLERSSSDPFRTPIRPDTCLPRRCGTAVAATSMGSEVLPASGAATTVTSALVDERCGGDAPYTDSFASDKVSLQHAAQQAANHLAKHALYDRSSSDNVTVIVVLFGMDSSLGSGAGSANGSVANVATAGTAVEGCLSSLQCTPMRK